MPRVLLVDEHLNSRMVMKAVLDPLDQEIVAVSSGREARRVPLRLDEPGRGEDHQPRLGVGLGARGGE